MIVGGLVHRRGLQRDGLAKMAYQQHQSEGVQPCEPCNSGMQPSHAHEG